MYRLFVWISDHAVNLFVFFNNINYFNYNYQTTIKLLISILLVVVALLYSKN